MTHTKTTIFSLFSYLLFSSQSFCMEINPCNQKLTTETEAKACLNWRLKNQGNGLYKKALTDGHRGNIKNCAESTGKDYFSDTENEFLSTIENVTLGNCEKDGQKWKCWGNTTGTKGCYSKKLTNRIFFSIGDGTVLDSFKKPKTILITFYPTASN
jgi:hypothetical protein